MKHEISCAWTGGMSFEADIKGHILRLDASKEDGGEDSGARPKITLLASLAGCTGMDVVSILRKMREPLSWFDMRVEGELADELPKPYTAFRIVYEFRASDGLNPENVKKAVELSQEKYCGVSATLKAAGPVDWDIVYL
ncbi:MAG TPA: OsmC family protein [Rectinemataceae bacterium]|nr:OsmC family protein [Rectinemataceae bacterium]